MAVSGEAGGGAALAGGSAATAGGGAALLPVTVTGPAADWADVTALRKAGVELADDRHAVVLILFDGRVPPERGDLELVHAVSAATGRCAVGLDLDIDRGRTTAAPSGAASPTSASPAARPSSDAPDPRPSADVFAAIDPWRGAVHPDVPVGPLDAGMARTLRLLADGPANPMTPTPGQRRRALLATQLGADRTGRIRARDAELARRRADVPHGVADAIEKLAEELSGPPAVTGPGQVDAAARRAARELAAALDLPVVPANPAAPEPPRPGHLTDAGLGLLTLGAAVGAGRLLAEPLTLVGLPGAVVDGAPIVAGTALAAAMAVAAGRRRKARQRAAWIAAHLAKVRRSWERGARDALRGAAAPPADGWRARHLADALKRETGG